MNTKQLVNRLVARMVKTPGKGKAICVNAKAACVWQGNAKAFCQPAVQRNN